MPLTSRTALRAAAAWLAFAAALAGASWLGVVSALRTLPPDALPPEIPSLAGASLRLEVAEEPLYLAESVQQLRDFHFAHQTPEARREGDAEARGLQRVFEPMVVSIIARDADAAEVEILEGPLAGQRFWISAGRVPGL